jgi:hypothetical protein
VFLDGSSLTPSQARALAQLRLHGSLTSRELSEQLGLSRSYAGSLLSALERASLATGELIGGGQVRFSLAAEIGADAVIAVGADPVGV